LLLQKQCQRERFRFIQMEVRHAGTADMTANTLRLLKKLQQIGSAITPPGLTKVRGLLPQRTLPRQISVTLDTAKVTEPSGFRPRRRRRRLGEKRKSGEEHAERDEPAWTEGRNTPPRCTARAMLNPQ
jgi:hypothetical protein